MTHRCATCVPGRDLCEAALTEAVIGEAHRLGWLVAHFRPARLVPECSSCHRQVPSNATHCPRCGGEIEARWRTAIQGDAGFPDLVLARRGTVLFVELKRAWANPRADQRLWLEAIGPGTSFVWRPAQWFSGRITEVLM